MNHEYSDINGDRVNAKFYCPNCCRPDYLSVSASFRAAVDPNTGAWISDSPNDSDMETIEGCYDATCNNCNWEGLLHNCELDEGDEHLLAPRGLLEDIEAMVEALWPEGESCSAPAVLQLSIIRINQWLGGGKMS